MKRLIKLVVYLAVILPILLLAVIQVHSAHVTAMGEASSSSHTWMGFSDGTVKYCDENSCNKLYTTPNSSVTAIIDAGYTSGDGSNNAWVGFDDGSVMKCNSNSGCQDTDESVSAPSVPSITNLKIQ